MELNFEKKVRYRTVDESKIETGNSIVYKAQDLEFNRTVCIKSIKINHEGSDSESEYSRALLEIKALVSVAELTAHVPVIHDVYYDKTTSRLYIVMQWINGDTLEQKYPSIPPLVFLGFIEKLCNILEKLEYKQMSHKDIKPSNIIITPDDEVFLIDFNLTISTPNQVEGTQNYKAPEMDANSKSIARNKVDIFSVGVMMYEYFTGKIPVRGVHYAVQSRRRSTEWDVFVEPKEINPELDPCINELISRCMKLDPKQRYRDSRDLKRAIVSAERTIRNGNRHTCTAGRIQRGNK